MRREALDVFRNDLLVVLEDEETVSSLQTVDAIVERVDGTFDIRLSLEASDGTRVPITVTVS